ncbi:MAG: hypothetical protein ABIK99_02300 [candidate division WOR-3 bacterium]
MKIYLLILGCLSLLTKEIDSFGYLRERWARLEKGRGIRRNFWGKPLIPESLIRDDFLLNGDTSGGAKQSHPRIRGNSQVVITFSDTRDGNADAHLQRFSLAGQNLGRNIRANDDWGLKWQGEPDLTILPNGNFVLGWEDRRDCNSDVYIQIFDPNGNKIGENIKVNDDQTRTDQRNVSLSLLGEDRFLVVWDDWRNDPGDIYGQIFNLAGIPIGSNFRVNEGTWLQYHPSCASDSLGNFVVAWQDGRGSSWDIYARRFDKDGNPLGSDFRVNDDNTNQFQGDPEVAMSEDGSFIIVWSDERNGNSDIYGQRFSPDGTRIGGNFLVNEMTSGNQSQPSITLTPSGEFFISYTDDRLDQGDIFLTAFEENGTRRWTIKVNDDQIGNYQGMSAVTIAEDRKIWVVWEDNREGNQDAYCQIFFDSLRVGNNFRVNDDSFSSHQRCSFLSVSGKGEFVCVWEDERGNDIDVYLQRFDTLGNLIGGNILVNDDHSSTHQFYPSVARDFLGRMFIAWTDTRSGESDIYGQFFDENGNPVGNNFLINDDTQNTQWYPVCAADSAGNFLVVWMDRRGENWDIYGQRFQGRNPVGNNFRINDVASGDQLYAYCAMAKTGSAVVTWMDNRDGDFEIYAQIYDENGNPVGNNFKVNESNSSFQGYPACARNERFLVFAWEDEREEDVSIYGQVFLNNGQRVGNNFRVNDDNTEEDQYSPTLDIAPNGDIIFVWCDGRRGRGDLDIYAQRFDSTLRRIGGNVLISNDDLFPGHNQWLIGQGIKIYKDKIGFSWIDNRRHKGWDIYGKLVNLNFLFLKEMAKERIRKFSPFLFGEEGGVLYDVKGAQVKEAKRKGVYILKERKGDRFFYKKFIKF